MRTGIVLRASNARSVLVISKSATHVNFVVKNLVTVEDLLPVDGAWVPKPVPPAGRMRGEMCLGFSRRLRCSAKRCAFMRGRKYGLGAWNEAPAPDQVHRERAGLSLRVLLPLPSAQPGCVRCRRWLPSSLLVKVVSVTRHWPRLS